MSNGRLNLLTPLIIAPLAFDYRGAEMGGGLVQFATSAICVLSIMIFLLGRNRIFVSLRVPYNITAVAGLLYLIGVSLANVVPFFQFSRVIFPVGLFVAGILVGWCFCREGRWRELAMWILIAGFISSGVRFATGFQTTGKTLEEIRYQILSPALPLLIAVVVYCALLLRKFSWWVLTLIPVVIVPSFFSVTRSLLLNWMFVCAAAVGIILVIPKNRVRSVMRFVGGVCLLSVVAGGCMAVVLMLNPAIGERWINRLLYQKTVTGTDATYLARVAELNGKLEALGSDPIKWISGVGVGATYYWDATYSTELVRYVSAAPFVAGSFFAGHSVWTFALHSGGLLGLAWMIWMWACPVVTFWKTRYDADTREMMDVGLLILVSYVSKTFTANPYSDRFAGLLIGLVFGGMISALAVRRSTKGTPRPAIAA